MTEPSQNLNDNQNQFAGSTNPKTNPFASDLKGEFTSNFGTNTNAVSQIFKEGGAIGENRSKLLLMGALLVVALGGLGYYFLGGSDTATDEFSGIPEGQEDAMALDGDEEAGAIDESGYEEDVEGVTEDDATEVTEATDQAPPVSSAQTDTSSSYSGAIALMEPASGQSRAYDETSEPAVFSWQGAGPATIYFSRAETMQPVERMAQVEGTSYEFMHPYPGNWYWQVQDASGAKSEIRSFSVEPPARRNIMITSPQAGVAVAGNGGAITWQGDKYVAFYRIELSNTGSWANPNYRFASSGNNIQLKDVAPGPYKIRLGGFSEVSGQWEYTEGLDITVQ